MAKYQRLSLGSNETVAVVANCLDEAYRFLFTRGYHSFEEQGTRELPLGTVYAVSTESKTGRRTIKFVVVQ
jgi:hypothetical protein